MDENERLEIIKLRLLFMGWILAGICLMLFKILQPATEARTNPNENQFQTRHAAETVRTEDKSSP